MHFTLYLLGNTVVLAFCLVFLGLGRIESQEAEREVISRIKRVGGEVLRDKDGTVYHIYLNGLKPGGCLDDGDVIAIGFSVFPKLKSVTLFSSEITDKSLKHLGSEIPNLADLNMSGAKISDEAMVGFLKKHRSIRSLILAKTSLTDRTLQEIANLKKLFTLCLSGTRITNGGMKHIGRLSELAVLDLGETAITDAGLGEICSIKSLGVLLLDGTKVTDLGIQQLHKLENLDTLRVSNTKVTEQGKKELQKALPNLKFVK